MSILNKSLNAETLATLDLFLQGALAPLNGYLNQQDHINVLQQGRLANGYLWPLPFSLTLTPAEKLQAQLARRIALVDAEQRVVAEVEVSEIYRLPSELAQSAEQKPGQWYVSGSINTVTKVLHPTFNRIRRNTRTMQEKLHGTEWQQVVAVPTTSGDIRQSTMKQACSWLTGNQEDGDKGSILLQVSAPDSPQLHEKMRTLRANIRCNAARQVVLNLLPEMPELSLERRLLLQARIAKNYGATGFLIESSTPATIQKALLRYRDELGLELIPAKRSQTARYQKYDQPQQEIALKIAA